MSDLGDTTQARLRAILALLDRNRRLQHTIEQSKQALLSRAERLSDVITNLDALIGGKPRDAVQFYRFNFRPLRSSIFLTLFKDIRNKGTQGIAIHPVEQSASLSYGEVEFESQYDPHEFEWNLNLRTPLGSPVPGPTFKNRAVVRLMSENSSDRPSQTPNATIQWKTPKKTGSTLHLKIRKRTRKSQINKYWIRRTNGGDHSSRPGPLRDSPEDPLVPQAAEWDLSHHSLPKSAKSRVSQLKIASETVQTLIRKNLPRIVEDFDLDLRQPLGHINFVDLADKLNTPKFLAFIQTPITAVDLYSVFIRLKDSRQPQPSLVSADSWEPGQLRRLQALVDRFGYGNWKQLSIFMGDKTAAECRKQYQRLRESKNWGFEDDVRLLFGVLAFNYRWNEIAARVFQFSKLETQCRERFANILDPEISQNRFSSAEALQLLFYHGLGMKWAWISKNVLTHRTDNRLLRKFRYLENTEPEFVEDVTTLSRRVKAVAEGAVTEYFAVRRPTPSTAPNQ